MQYGKKFLSLLMAVVFCLSLLPVSVWAEDEADAAQTTEETVFVEEESIFDETAAEEPALTEGDDPPTDQPLSGNENPDTPSSDGGDGGNEADPIAVDGPELPTDSFEGADGFESGKRYAILVYVNDAWHFVSSGGIATKYENDSLLAYNLWEFVDSDGSLYNGDKYLCPKAAGDTTYLGTADSSSGNTWSYDADGNTLCCSSVGEGDESAKYVSGVTEDVNGSQVFTLGGEASPVAVFRYTAEGSPDDGGEPGGDEPGSGLSAWPVLDSQEANTEGEVALWVIAQADQGLEPLTFTWYEKVEEADGSDGTVMRGDSIYKLLYEDHGCSDGDRTKGYYYLTGVTAETEILCVVADQNKNAVDVFLTVHPYTGLDASAKYNNWRVLVKKGEPATVEVVASTVKGGSLTYQWYVQTDDGDKPIGGATEASYTTEPVTGLTRYGCRVSDGINAKWVWIEVGVDTGLRVTPKSFTEFYVKKGDSVDLAVTVTADEEMGLKIQWFKDDDRETCLGDEGSCTVNYSGEGEDRYVCVVTDTYGVSEEVWFFIRPEADKPGDYGHWFVDTAGLLKVMEQFQDDLNESERYACYVGRSEFSFDRAVTIPGDFNVDFRGWDVLIPADADNLTIYGSMNAGKLTVPSRIDLYGRLSVTEKEGTVNYCEVDEYVPELWYLVDVTSEEELQAAVKNKLGQYEHMEIRVRGDIVLQNSLVLGGIDALSIDWDDFDGQRTYYTLAVPENETLQVNDLNVRGTLVLNGTLENNGNIRVSYGDGGRITVGERGTITGDGSIEIHNCFDENGNRMSLKDILPRTVTDGYFEEKIDDGWRLYKDAHCFSTMEQLRAIVNKFDPNDDPDEAWARYVPGTENAVFNFESINLPGNLELDFGRADRVAIPDGVTVTLTRDNEWNTTLDVRGKLVLQDELRVDDGLAVKDSDDFDAMMERIEFSEEDDSRGRLVVNYALNGGVDEYVSVDEALGEALTFADWLPEAEDDRPDNVILRLQVYGKAQIDDTYEFPRTVELNVERDWFNDRQVAPALRIGSGASLTMNGYIELRGTLTVDGTLENNGNIRVSYGDGGRITVGERGTITGGGSIEIHDCFDENGDRMSLKYILPQTVTDGYFKEEIDDGWRLYKDAHCFSTMKQLRAVIESGETWARYVPVWDEENETEDAVFTFESINLPGNLELDFGRADCVAIPYGVTVTLARDNEWNTTLDVQGRLVLRDELRVDWLAVGSEDEFDAMMERIDFSEENDPRGRLVVNYALNGGVDEYVSVDDALSEALAFAGWLPKAEDDRPDNVILRLQVYGKAQINDGIYAFPRTVELNVERDWFDGRQVAPALCIDSGASLTMNGHIDLRGTLIVDGTLENNGDIWVDEQGVMTFTEGSTYTGNGRIDVRKSYLNDKLIPLKDRLVGLGLSQFFVDVQDDAWHLEQGGNRFSTMKQLGAVIESGETWAEYVPVWDEENGTEDAVFNFESIVLPGNLELDFGRADRVVIPDGATVTLARDNEWNTTLDVRGKLVLQDELRVDGLAVGSENDFNAMLDKIDFSNGRLVVNCALNGGVDEYVSVDDALSEALAFAEWLPEAEDDWPDNVILRLQVYGKAQIDGTYGNDGAYAFPRTVELNVERDWFNDRQVAPALRIGPGASLTMNGYMQLRGTLIVQGMLVNNGSISLVDENARITLAGADNYGGNGRLELRGIDPTGHLVRLDLTSYIVVEEYDEWDGPVKTYCKIGDWSQFDDMDDLRAIAAAAAAKPGEWYWCECVSETFTFESIEIPENLTVNLGEGIIPDGVTVTVNGGLNAGWLNIGEAGDLIVKGYVNVDLRGEIDEQTEEFELWTLNVKNITYCVEIDSENAEEVWPNVEASAAAIAEQVPKGSQIRLSICTAVEMDQDFEVPACLLLELRDGGSLTVPEETTLRVLGRVELFGGASMTVRGTLRNENDGEINGEINLNVEDRDTHIAFEGGTFEGLGPIDIYTGGSGEDEKPDDFLWKLDLSEFDCYQYEDYCGWRLEPIDWDFTFRDRKGLDALIDEYNDNLPEDGVWLFSYDDSKFTLEDDLEIPEGINVEFGGGVTIPAEKTLTVNGSLGTHGVLTVNGTLANNGDVILHCYNGVSKLVVDGGSYSGNGFISALTGSEAEPDDSLLTGLSFKDFLKASYTDPFGNWAWSFWRVSDEFRTVKELQFIVGHLEPNKERTIQYTGDSSVFVLNDDITLPAGLTLNMGDNMLFVPAGTTLTVNGEQSFATLRVLGRVENNAGLTVGDLYGEMNIVTAENAATEVVRSCEKEMDLRDAADLAAKYESEGAQVSVRADLSQPVELKDNLTLPAKLRAELRTGADITVDSDATLTVLGEVDCLGGGVTVTGGKLQNDGFIALVGNGYVGITGGSYGGDGVLWDATESNSFTGVDESHFSSITEETYAFQGQERTGLAYVYVEDYGMETVLRNERAMESNTGETSVTLSSEKTESILKDDGGIKAKIAYTDEPMTDEALSAALEDGSVKTQVLIVNSVDEQAVQEAEKIIPNGSVILRSLDLKVELVSNAETIGTVTETNEPIRFTIVLEQDEDTIEKLKGNIYVVRIHGEGETQTVETVPAQLNGNVLTFRADKFSSYTVFADQATAENTYEFGDITQDGKINTADLLRLLRIVNNNMGAGDYVSTDLNGSGNTDSADLLHLLKYVNGQIKTLL